MDNQRVISKDAGKEAALRMGTPFFEVSAMSGQSVDQAFQSLAEVIVRKKELFLNDGSHSYPSYPYRVPIEDEPISVGDEDEHAKKKSPLCCRK